MAKNSMIPRGKLTDAELEVLRKRMTRTLREGMRRLVASRILSADRALVHNKAEANCLRCMFPSFRNEPHTCGKV